MENINKFEKNPEKEFLYDTEGRLNSAEVLVRQKNIVIFK